MRAVNCQPDFRPRDTYRNLGEAFLYDFYNVQRFSFCYPHLLFLFSAFFSRIDFSYLKRAVNRQPGLRPSHSQSKPRNLKLIFVTSSEIKIRCFHLDMIYTSKKILKKYWEKIINSKQCVLLYIYLNKDFK